MKISGFSFVRNGFDYGVPFVESIKSILPICDEFVISVGDSTDGTREAIEAIPSDKIKIIDTIWDMNLRKGGKIFAQQTNIAHDAITGDWAFHIQSDEVIHENDLPVIKQAIEKEYNNSNIDGFLFPFLHFWGDYNHIQTSRRVHRFEVRLFRNNKMIRSYKDSQGFRIYTNIETYNSGDEQGKKLSVKLLKTPVFHYNGVRQESVMKNKFKNFSYFYGKDHKFNENEAFNYHRVQRVAGFGGSHPAVMKERIDEYD